jgi:hypothetical protein
MNPHRSTQAENTTVMLQQASQCGVPVLIPGAREMRAATPSAQPVAVSAEPAWPQARLAAISDRARLEREREGGGAPSQRLAGRPATLLAKLWHCVLHPTDIGAIWRPPLPQQR